MVGYGYAQVSNCQARAQGVSCGGTGVMNFLSVYLRIMLPLAKAVAAPPGFHGQ